MAAEIVVVHFCVAVVEFFLVVFSYFSNRLNFVFLFESENCESIIRTSEKKTDRGIQKKYITVNEERHNSFLW
jgi:hypothetical protein